MTAFLVVRTFALAAALAPAGDARLQRAATTIAAKLRAIAPAGWSVRVEDTSVLLERNEPVLFFVAINPPPPPPFLHGRAREQWLEEHGRRERFRIVFRLAPPIGPGEYREMKGRVRALQRKAAELETAMARTGMPCRIDSCLPATPEQEALVTAYKVAKAEARDAVATLPSVLIPGASLFISDNWPGVAEEILEREIAVECYEVQTKAYRLFRATRPER